MDKTWSSQDRLETLKCAEADGVDLIVIGGGITGAGILRDAANRDLKVLMLEKGDFASGTSSWSSKLVHGGLRYIAQYHFGLTRESCLERDLLVKHNPNLVRPLSSLFPAYKGSKEPLWKVRLGLGLYSALSNFRKTSRFDTLNKRQTLENCPDLNADNLQGSGHYYDAQVDDARLVLETIKNARDMGAEAVNYAKVCNINHTDKGKIKSVTVSDSITGKEYKIRASVIINSTGPHVEKVRSLDHQIEHPEIRPAKGVHLVIPSDRIQSKSFVSFKSDDNRHLFYIPWGDVALLGTTDTFSKEIDNPTVSQKDVDYILAATNKAFPNAQLTEKDICSVYAGVRPLVQSDEEKTPSNAISREHKVWIDPSGLISVSGGKLTTFRQMGKEVNDIAIKQLPKKTRKNLKKSNTKHLSLRNDKIDTAILKSTLSNKFNLNAKVVEHLIQNYGDSSIKLMEEAKPEERGAISTSMFTYAEIPWVINHESATNLTDILERRMRMAIFSKDQGLTEINKIASIAAKAAGWDHKRKEQEIKSYKERIKLKYSIQP
jgi:glycerol-3-phosphate dehydrogenase